MMLTAANLYKRTANLSESEPRMTSAWDGFKGGQLFDVPLHDTNRQYATVSTGLVRVQPDSVAKGSLIGQTRTTILTCRLSVIRTTPTATL